MQVQRFSPSYPVGNEMRETRMNIQLDSSVPFNLDFTLCCGQVFRWDKQGEWWYGTVDDGIIKIRQNGRSLEFENSDRRTVVDYFGLDHDLQKILSQIRKDRYIGAVIERFAGLRIVRQNPWECLASYICATYKNVTAIRRILENLSVKFGERIRFEGQTFYRFPTAAQLAKATDKQLAECELGYRAKHLSATAKIVHENRYDIDSLKRVNLEKGKEELLKFPGVGLKVADCVSLFSLGKLEAFPVDVWIKRAIMRYYSSFFPKKFVQKVSCGRSLANSEYMKLSVFGREYFGENAGYAQEYFYHYERTRSCH